MGEPTDRSGAFHLRTGQRFRVKWDDRYIEGVSHISALRRVTEAVTMREGTDPSLERQLPGRSQYEPITLERGITHDTEFEDWANKVLDAGAGGPESFDFMKDIVIELLNERDQPIRVYKVFRCWVVEYEAISDLDANANAVAIESIKLEHEGWERSESVTPPGDADRDDDD
jgi:phage tail-like protein